MTTPEAMLLTTERPAVLLRRWQDTDRDELVAQADNRAIWRNLTDAFPHPYTASDAERWITLSNQPSRSLHLCIEVDGRAAGGVGLIAREGVYQRTAQFGYWLGERYWGQGIGTAAASAMVAHAHARLPFVRLEASVFAWNPRSMRLLEKVGFTREGVRRCSVYKDGQLIDSILYALVLADA